MNARPADVNPKFLSVLDADPVRAEQAYRELVIRLRRFFEWKGCVSPDDLAQETLARGFKRIAQGQQVYSEKPSSYFMGIARNVLSEWWKKKKEEPLDPENPPDIGFEEPDQSIHHRILLEKVLSLLSPQDREFLIEYTLEDRNEMGRRRGESINALRIRAFRIREAIRAEFVEMQP